MNLTVGSEVTVVIEKLSLGGDGIARVGSSGSRIVLFVPYSAPGDHVRVGISDVKKSYARGRVLEILKEGDGRTKPDCPYYFSPSSDKWCGGCNFQHLRYDAQIKGKSEMLRETIEKIAGVPSVEILPVLGMHADSRWRYRNKIQIPFGKDEAEKAVVAGFYSRKSHEIVPIDDCLIHSEEMMVFVRFVADQMNRMSLEPYTEKNHSGWLRHLLIRREEQDGKMIAVFVTANKTFPHRSEWARLTAEKFPHVAGICQNINPDRTNVILGKQWKNISGADTLIEKLDGLGAGGAPLKLKVFVGSFFQVNTKMASAMYRLVREWLTEKKNEKQKTLIDLYCGVGGVGLSCASLFDKVIGVDQTVSSIYNAKGSARLNRITHCDFLCSDVLKFLKHPSAAPSDGSSAVIVLDPPRSGCPEEVLNRIIQIGPGIIVYISCDPSTLARDLKILIRSRYAIRKIRPVDLFPESSHIESVVLLEKAGME